MEGNKVGIAISIIIVNQLNFLRYRTPYMPSNSNARPLALLVDQVSMVCRSGNIEMKLQISDDGTPFI